MSEYIETLKEELKQYYKELLDALEQISEIAKELAPKARLETLQRQYKDSWDAAIEYLKGAGAVLNKANAAINAFQKLRQNPTLENCEEAYFAFLNLGYSVFPLYPKLKGFELAQMETPPTIFILKRITPFDRIPEFLNYEVMVSYSEIKTYAEIIHQNALKIATLISILCFDSHSKQALVEELKSFELEEKEESSSLNTNHEEEEFEHGI